MRGFAAAAHLLRHSHLGVELDDYADEAGSLAWERLATEHGHSGSAVALIQLARSLAEGALGGSTRLDGDNYDAFLSALDVLAHGSEAGGDPVRAGRRR